MKAVGFVRVVLASLAVAGASRAQALGAAVATAEQPTLVGDVALTTDGRLIGQVIDRQGSPLAGAPVTIHDQHRRRAATRTDAAGYFAVTGLRSGIYQVVAADGQALYRVWAPGMAPPGARQGALVVAGEELMRGQFSPSFPFGGFGGLGLGGLGGVFSSPWLTAAAVAASVGAPVAAHNAQKSRIESPPTSP